MKKEELELIIPSGEEPKTDETPESKTESLKLKAEVEA